MIMSTINMSFFLHLGTYYQTFIVSSQIYEDELIKTRWILENITIKNRDCHDIFSWYQFIIDRLQNILAWCSENKLCNVCPHIRLIIEVYQLTYVIRNLCVRVFSCFEFWVCLLYWQTIRL
jgi:hypothetical protein